MGAGLPAGCRNCRHGRPLHLRSKAPRRCCSVWHTTRADLPACTPGTRFCTDSHHPLYPGPPVAAGTIDLLAYTDKENEVPLDWEESDPRYITNAADVKLRAFSTKVGAGQGPHTVPVMPGRAAWRSCGS